MKDHFTRNDGTDGVGEGIGMEFMRMTGKAERYGGRNEGQLEQQPTPHLLHTVGQLDLTRDGRWSFDENDNKPDPDRKVFGGRIHRKGSALHPSRLNHPLNSMFYETKLILCKRNLGLSEKPQLIKSVVS